MHIHTQSGKGIQLIFVIKFFKLICLSLTLPANPNVSLRLFYSPFVQKEIKPKKFITQTLPFSGGRVHAIMLRIANVSKSISTRNNYSSNIELLYLLALKWQTPSHLRKDDNKNTKLK